ncbi:serine hydrolase domain-containing protein [Dawidia cretensis]|uniref:serine hydrolase domain-containing protein n=1 Tax=Dawidia cretensis TaxID=2782350 RepID=UPI0020B1A27C|nr:serine hydrolase domain-containing protein [Dawidia cretensis]
MCTFALLTSLSACHDDNPAISGDPKERIVALARENNLPTLTVLIQKDTGTYALHYKNPHADIQEIETYGIGSTTKFLSAIVILKYVEQNYLRLDDPINHYIAEKDLTTISWFSAITLRHLLNHTSGIPDYTQNPAWLESAFNGNAPATTPEKIALIPSDNNYALGQFRYSNSNYILLQQILEQVSGQSAQKIFNDFYTSIGLRDITLDTGDVYGQAFYAENALSSRNVSTWQEHYGYDGAAYASADDLATLLKKVFVEKTILQEESLTAMTTWTTMGDRSLRYGEVTIDRYGLGLTQFQLGDRIFIGHPGGTLKYQSFAFIEPATGTTFILLTNGAGPYYTKAFFSSILNEAIKIL